MIDLKITTQVRSTWHLFSQSSLITFGLRQKIPGLDEQLILLEQQHGFNIIESQLIDLHIKDVYTDSQMHLYIAITESQRNARNHGGDVYFTLTRYSPATAQPTFFESYIFDKGDGFPLDKHGIPQIQDALKPYVSLSPYGECGLGLTNAVEAADICEIECSGFLFEKKSPTIHKLPFEPIKGVMIHLLKYI